MKRLNLTGQKFGRLTVLELDHVNKQGQTCWLCKCACGNNVIVSSHHLKDGNTVSCGCYARERRSLRFSTHKSTKTRLFCIWTGMLKRTGYYRGYKQRDKINYIDRGIDVCKEWMDFTEFQNWSLNNGYNEELEIDRIDNDKGYSPDNCRWTTRKVNMRNTRQTIRLLDGTPFVDFLDALNITDKKARNKYRDMWSKHKKIHPELKQIMFETMD